MSGLITRYFDLAQLALASYTDFTSLFGTSQIPLVPSASGVRDAILGDFPFPLANTFSGVTNSQSGFQVLSQRTDASGFSATLFQNRETGEKVLTIRGTEPTQVLDILEEAKGDRLLFRRGAGPPAWAERGLQAQGAGHPRLPGRSPERLLTVDAGA